MQDYCKIVKNKLNSIIMGMEKNISEFVVDSKRDFIRRSELSFSKTIKIILGMGGKTLAKELLDFYDFDSETVSVSALVQRRTKILPSAFYHVFQSFNASFAEKNFLKRYRLYAIDGSDVHIPTIPSDSGTYYCANENSKGYNLMHLNALYDLMNHRYSDAVIQDSRNENENTAIIEMLNNISKDSIIVADRNYESYNNMAHIENKGAKYVIRIKENGIIKKVKLPDSEEFDIDLDVFLSRKNTKEHKNDPMFRFISKNSTFDFIPLNSEKIYPLSFRIVRVKVSENMFETLVTNLSRDEFSTSDIKRIYKLRWGIETAFRELKYNLNLNAFHSKKKDCVIQEIFSRLLMYNFSILISANIIIEQSDNNKYHSKINLAAAFYICLKFFRSDHVSPSDIETLLAKYILPIRHNRKAPRSTRYHSAVCFNYRLS